MEVQGTELPRPEVAPGTLEVRERMEDQVGMELAVEVPEVTEQVMEVVREEMEEVAERVE